MSDIVINVEEPEVIISDEYSQDYNLPIASSSTLGGVKIGDNISETSDGTISVPIASSNTAGVIKVGDNLSITDGVLSASGSVSIVVDNALSTTSTNPVQNRVITNTITPISDDVQTLQESISSISGDISDIEESISTTNSNVTTNSDNISLLQTAVQTNTDNISTNTSNIASNSGLISDLDGRLTTDEGYITSQGNALGQLQDNVNALSVAFVETANGTDIDNTIWTGGAVTIIRRGKVGFVTLDLEGSYTFAGSSSKLVYTMSDQDNLPTYVGKGCLYTDDGAVYAEFDTDGKVIIYNYGSSNINLSYLMGSIPVVFI